MTETDSTAAGENEPPYTTDELNDKDIALLDIDDQIRYAVFNGNHRLGEIIEISSFDKDWTTDIVEDMVDEGDLVKSTDSDGPFYQLPKSERQSTISEEELDEIHEKALDEYHAETTLGDEEDMSLVDVEPEIESDTPESYADAAEALESDTDDTLEMSDDEELPDADEVESAIADHGGQLPADRDYDWDEMRLDESEVPEYIEANGEYQDIKQEIEMRREINKLPHFCISGPTGCGKTLLAENIAMDLGPDDKSVITIEIHCHEGLRPSNLLGMPTYVGGETWWVDGPVPKALLASQDTLVVVILDEVNRTSSRTLGVLMSMLDHQCRVTLDARGGEEVSGNPQNLIVFSTMNEGEGYVVNSLDTAQKRRLGNKYYTDYIGMADTEAEAELITDRTPIGMDVAREMVDCANAIRKKAQGDSAISMGIPTDAMLDWAATAWAYRDHTTSKGSVIKAGERAVLNKFYRGDEREEDTVTEAFDTYLEGMEVGEHSTMDEEDELSAMDEDVTEDESIDVSDDTYLMCESCGWYELTEDADEDTVTSMTCPECSDPVIPKDSA